MILTSHRLDCFKLAIDFLAHGGSLQRFDHVVLLCSGLPARHRRYVESLPGSLPEIPWEFLHGPRGRGKPISDLQNECVRRHPDSLYFKIDEDTFVSSDWDLVLADAYAQHSHDPRLSLLTPVVTNNQRGAYFLMNLFHELGEEFTQTFNQPIVNERMGPVWLFPQCAEFMIRRFLNLDAANAELRERLKTEDRRPQTTDPRPQTSGTHNEAPAAQRQEPSSPSTLNLEPSTPAPSAAHHAPLQTFSYPFSINCICYDYRHWLEIGGVPEQDENGWGEWIPSHDKYVVLAARALVHHYAFFVQQRWLDRTPLLEDLRRENLPHTLGWQDLGPARARRWLQQVPAALLQRIRPR